MKKIRLTEGFTLIELLIVLVIIGVTLSLIAPDMYRTFQKVQVKNEVSTIDEIIALSKERSFFSSKKINLVFEEDFLVVSELSEGLSSDKKELKRFYSRFFSFEKTLLTAEKGELFGAESIVLEKSPEASMLELPLGKHFLVE